MLRRYRKEEITMLKRYTMIAAFLLAWGGMAMAQTDGYTGRVAVRESVEKTGGEVKVHLDIDLDGLEMKAQHALVLTPVLESKDKSMKKELAPVLVNGRIRQKVYRRNVSLGKERGSYQEVVRRANGQPQQVSYDVSLPYERWMRGASLMLREEVSGCAACELGEDARTLSTLFPIKAISEPVYTVLFCVPGAEEVKRRDEQCELHLTYGVGASNVALSLGNNRAEIKRLQDMVDRVKRNNDFTLTGFRINGYASPEGSFRSNMLLSERRSKALAEHFRRANGWAPELFRTTWSGEDWKGLAEAVEASALPRKAEVLDIIKTVENPDARDAKIRAIDGGETYNTLLRDFYPPLRRSLCVVDFTVRTYTAEEARRIIKENPRLLSLREMYEVANSYPKDSEGYNEAHLTAQRLYPNDPDAVTNAAAVLLTQGRNAEAKEMLLKAGERTGTICNSLGIVYAKEKDYARAAACFEEAAQKGYQDAAGNAAALKKFIEELNENNF